MKSRIITGGLFLAGVAALYLFAPAWVLALVVLGLTGLAVLETIGLLEAAEIPALKWTCLTVSLLWMLTTWMTEAGTPLWAGMRSFMPALAAWAIFLGCLFRSDQSRSLDKLTGSFLTVAYAPALMQFILLLLYAGQGDTDGRSLLLYGILVVKSTDMGAYFIGSAIGRHKLIPRISPAKTLEGVAGGIGVAMLVSVLLVHLYGYEISGIPIRLGDGLLLGALLSGFGVLGDLVESMLKRSAGIKDSGTWVKGLGGILDVLDSLMFALPVLYIYLQWVHTP